MSAIFAWPTQLKQRDPGVAMTFVVPAATCNLNCSFCAISARREAERTSLSPYDYTSFIEDIVKSVPTAIVSIQGYEPTLEQSWEFTEAILAKCNDLNIPSSMVTNGIRLKEVANDLAALRPDGVTVSIDSADPIKHDQLRGTPGAFEQTVSGIRRLAEVDDFSKRITVSSVLFPRKRHFLTGMPKLLAELGVKHWAISPLLSIGDDSVGGPKGESNQIIDDVLALHDAAAKQGVTVVLDDELGRLESRDEDYQDFLIRRFNRPDGLIRLSPDGSCSAGADILKTVNATTPIWDPAQENGWEFLSKRVLKNTRAIH